MLNRINCPVCHTALSFSDIGREVAVRCPICSSRFITVLGGFRQVEFKDYYDILNLPPHTSRRELQKAWRELIMRWHPDRNPGNPVAEEKTRELNELRERLFDPAKRRDYDLLYNAKTLDLWNPTSPAYKNRFQFEEPTPKRPTQPVKDPAWDAKPKYSKRDFKERNVYYGVDEDGYVERPSWAGKGDDLEWNRRARKALSGDLLLEARGNVGCVLGTIIGFLTLNLWGIIGGGIIGWLIGIGLSKSYLRTAWFNARATIAGIVLGMLVNVMTGEIDYSIGNSFISEVTGQTLLSAVIGFLLGVGYIYMVTDRPSRPSKRIMIQGIIASSLGLIAPCFIATSTFNQTNFIAWLFFFVFYVVIDAIVTITHIVRLPDDSDPKRARESFRP